MNNEQISSRIANLVVVVVVASAVNFFAMQFYVGKIIDREIQNKLTTSQNGSNQAGKIAGDSVEVVEGLKSRILDLNEASGTIVEVKEDSVRIKPSGELLGGINDQMFVIDYLRDRTVKITDETKIMRQELEKKSVTSTPMKISELKVGDYVMVISKEGIGNKTEFTASSLFLP